MNDISVRKAINDLVGMCHDASMRAGWWNDLKTGESLLDQPNIVPAKIALIHSEISEAFEGWRKDLMDDHLPHRKSIEVELADALIRLFDLAGALQMDLGGAFLDKKRYNETREDHKRESRLKDNGKKL